MTEDAWFCEGELHKTIFFTQEFKVNYLAQPYSSAVHVNYVV